MKTELVNRIIELAREYSEKNHSEQVYNEYIFLAVLKIAEDKKLLEGCSYNAEEYDALLKAVHDSTRHMEVQKLEDYLAEKEYTDKDEEAARAFKRWMSFANHDATQLFRKLDSEVAFGKENMDQEKSKRQIPKRGSRPETDPEEENEEGSDEDSAEKAAEETVQTLPELIKTVSGLRSALSEKVVGQSTVIKEFVEGYFRGEVLAATKAERKGPRSVFLFAGSSGVGKTYMAEVVAEAIGIPFKKFDMSGFSNDTGEISLTGISGSYKDAKKGLLTGFVKDNPHCIILFDEVEKTTPNIIQFFLQILDAGILFDNYLEKNVSFADAIVIMTTNAGKNLYEASENRNLSGTPKQLILEALRKDTNPQTGRPYFPEAVCSRLGSGTVLMFNRLCAGDMIRIAEREFSKNVKSIESTYQIGFVNETDLAPSILYSIGGQSDARQATAQASKFLYREFFELLRMIENQKGVEQLEKLKTVRWEVDFTGTSEELQQLYRDDRSMDILLYGSEELKEAVEGKQGEGILAVTSPEQAALALQKRDVALAIVDFYHGVDAGQAYLNAEDIASEGRKVFEMLLKDYPDIPVYILQTKEYAYGAEETLSLTGKGAQDIILLPLDDADALQKTLDALRQEVCYQRALSMLALRHQMLTFDTRQVISQEGTEASICLYNLKLAQAIESEDRKSILSAEAKPQKHWEDVVVSEDVKEELTYYIDFLKNPKKAMAKGARAPKGLLMYGPPGTGKTSLAKVIATEADVTFLEVGADQFLSKWVGEGPENVHRMFATARKYAPAILFIDEIDAIGKTRSESGEDNDSTHEILNALLTEMDGFKRVANKPVFVMAATNLGGNNGNTRGLDPALVRRFDRSINIDLPDKEGRKKIFTMLRDKNEILQISDAEIENLAVRSIGMSPANIEAAVETAIRDAIRSDSNVDDSIMDEAFEKFNSGEEKHWESSELLRTARHEAGHAFVCNYFGEKPSYLTIVARDNHGGYMAHGDNEKKGSYTKEELLQRICTSLGGRAAEIVYYGDADGVTTGPSSDLEHATSLARSMVCRYGMYDELGIGTMEKIEGEAGMEVNRLVNRILSEELEQAKEIIRKNQATMDRLVDVLMEKMHLTEQQIQETLQG